MKTWLKAVLLATAALCAIVGVAAAAASASTPAWYVGGAQLSGSTALTAKAPEVEHVQIDWGPGLYIECGAEAEMKNAVLSSPTGGSVESIVFKGCASPGPCSLEGTTVKTKPLTMVAALGKLGSEDTVVFKPTAGPGKPWAEFTIRGATCSAAEEYVLKGQATFQLPKGRTEAATQELGLKVEGSSEELNGGIGSISMRGAIKLTLASGKAWSFH